MFLILAITLAQAAPAAPIGPQPGAADDSIVVIGERLKGAGAAISVNPITGKMKCKVKVPSGNARVDTAACEIGLQCARQHRRDRTQFESCVTAGREAFLDSYFAEGRVGNSRDE